MPPRKESKSSPWVLLIEFPCWADADTARQMIREILSDEITLRAKHQHPSDGNVARWRTTAIMREAMGARSFTSEDVEKVMLEHGYNGTANWLTTAKRHGVIVAIRERRGPEGGIYRFAPNPIDKLLPHDPQCNHCQPEPLQCAAL